jgi:hypothetical protein
MVRPLQHCHHEALRPPQDAPRGFPNLQSQLLSMIFRIASIWICVSASGICSFFQWILAYWLKNLLDQTLGGQALPRCSQLFYPPSISIYWYPLIFVVWATVVTVKYRQSSEHALLLSVSTLASLAVFTCFYSFSVILPFLPMKIHTLL